MFAYTATFSLLTVLIVLAIIVALVWLWQHRR